MHHLPFFETAHRDARRGTDDVPHARQSVIRLSID